MTDNALSIAKQISASQRLMLAQIHLGDDVEPRNGAVRQALEEKGLIKQTTGWESMKLTDEGQAVAEVVALAALETISPNVWATLLSVANNRYEPEDRYRHHLSAGSLAVNDAKAKTTTLTALGRSAAAILMMRGDAPADAQPDEEPAPATIEETAPPTETDPRKIAALLHPASRQYLTELIWGGRYLPGDELYHSLLKYKLVKEDDGIRGKVVTTSLGNQVATVLFETPVNAPNTQPHAIDEEPTPILPAPATPPVDTEQPLNGAEQTMLFQVLHGRPISPLTPHTRDVLVQRGLITVLSELMWTLELTPAGEAAAQRLELLDFVPISDRSRLWRILQGERVHEREMTDTPNHLKLVTYGESDDENLGIANLTDSGQYHAGRIVEYVAKRLMDFYPNRVRVVMNLYREPDAHAYEMNSIHGLDLWGLLTPNQTLQFSLSDFGRAVAAALEIMEAGYALADITPPAQPEKAPGSQWPEELASPEEIARRSKEQGITVEEAIEGITKTFNEEDEAPAPDPVEEDDAPPTDDRAALLAELNEVRAALADATEALGNEWMKRQDPKLISHKIGQLHKTTQHVLRGQSEAAAKRAEKAEADNAALRAQLKAIKQVAAATTTGDGDELATLRAHLSEVMSERDNLRAQLDEANLTSTRNAREVFQTSRQLADALDAIKKHAEEADTATRRADRAESDLHTIQQTAQRWQAEHQAAITEAARLNAIVEQLTAEIPAGHTIVTDATPAHLDRLTAEQRAILHMQFMPDGKLYVVAGPAQRPQPQPDKPAAVADHFVEPGNMVYDHPTEEAEIIDEEEVPAPDPVGAPEPVYVFSPADQVTGTEQMVQMMRAGMPADQITAELNKANQADARAEFARRQAASFTNPPPTRSGPPPRRALTTGQ